jgi:hypothetical protein
MSRVLEVEVRLNRHLCNTASISMERPEPEQFASCLTMSRKTQSDLKYSTTSVAPELVQKLLHRCSNGSCLSLHRAVFTVSLTISSRTSSNLHVLGNFHSPKDSFHRQNPQLLAIFRITRLKNWEHVFSSCW